MFRLGFMWSFLGCRAFRISDFQLDNRGFQGVRREILQAVQSTEFTSSVSVVCAFSNAVQKR